MRFFLPLLVISIFVPAALADSSFTVLLSPGVAPCTIHVNGLTAVPADVDVTRCTFDWDFGDPHTQYNTLSGFNAAHCFNHAGTYSIQLTLTNPTGQRRVMSANVVIGKDTRRIFFVAPDGSDSNAGMSPDAPLRSMPNLKKLGDDSEVRFRAGGTYALPGTLQVPAHNALISRYGEGADPVLQKLTGGPILATQNNSDGVIIEHLKFTTPHEVAPGDKAPKVGTDAVVGRGKNLTVRDCVFDNVDIGVNANGGPVGLLVQNCDAPTVNSLRAYLVWGQGSDHVYLGNHDANSTQEHCIRTSGVSRVLLAYNTLANHGSKGCIEIHIGKYAWVAHNTVTRGDIRTGPLGLHEPPTTATEWCVIDSNVVNDSFIFMQRGSHHVRIRNNIVHADNTQAIVINGPDGDGRVCDDITIAGNTAVNHGEHGAFLRIWGKTSGLSLLNNLYVAPNLKPGSNGTFIVGTQQPDLADFAIISNNVWPDLKSNSQFTVGGTATKEKWIATSPVKGDRFENVQWNDPASQPGR